MKMGSTWQECGEDGRTKIVTCQWHFSHCIQHQKHQISCELDAVRKECKYLASNMYMVDIVNEDIYMNSYMVDLGSLTTGITSWLK